MCFTLQFLHAVQRPLFRGHQYHSKYIIGHPSFLYTTALIPLPSLPPPNNVTASESLSHQLSLWKHQFRSFQGFTVWELRRLHPDVSIEGSSVSRGCRALTSRPACLVGGGRVPGRLFQDVSVIFPDASCPGANTEMVYFFTSLCPVEWWCEIYLSIHFVDWEHLDKGGSFGKPTIILQFQTCYLNQKITLVLETEHLSF